MLLILLGCLMCLFPTGMYCLFLASLNNRRSPTLVQGHWDFAGVLLALSGFLLFGGPALLSGLHENWRQAWMRGRPADIVALFAADRRFWLIVWGLYFVCVVGGAAWLLRRRARTTAIYNIEADALESTLADVLDRLGVVWSRHGDAYTIGPDAVRNGLAGSAHRAALKRLGLETVVPDLEPAAPRSALAGARAAFEVDAFPASCHATLHWAGTDPGVRRGIERELAGALAAVPTHANPAGGWFLTAAAALFLVMLFSLGLFIFYIYAQNR